MTTIPASQIVSVIPSVLSVGGTGLNGTGLFLENNARIPIGTVVSFPNATAVQAYYGAGSYEASEAAIYFAGFNGASIYPSALLMAQYNTSAVSAYLRGGNISALTIAQLQALSGSLTVVMDGYAHVIAAISLAGYLTQTAIATAIQTAFPVLTEASFTASIGASMTASVGGSFTTCTTTGTTLTIGAVGSGYLSAGDLVSATDGTHALPAGCYVVAQLTGTPGGSAGATFQISAAATGGNMASATVTATSTVVNATVVTGYISAGDTVTTISANAVIASQLTGTTGGAGTYQLSGITAQGIASGAMVSSSNVLDVTVIASPTLASGQALVNVGLTGSPVITSQISGTAGSVGFYRFSGAQQKVTSSAFTSIAVTPVVTFDSLTGAFVFTSGITGVPSTAAYATGTLAASLFLTSATGAVLSQGAAPATPSAFMNNLIVTNSSWVNFMTLFDPDLGTGNTQKQAFAAWKNTALGGNRFGYTCWDPDGSPAASYPAAASLGQILAGNGDSGTTLIWEIGETQDDGLGAFNLGWAASINYNAKNGRADLAFRAQSGLVANVTDPVTASNLNLNGYNFYGAYGSGNSNFIWFQTGQITGPFKWADSYQTQIWLNSYLQVTLLTLFQNTLSIPFSVAGASIIQQALSGPIQQGLSFGAYGPGTLSSSQIIAVNTSAGVDIANTIQSQGYYLQVNVPPPTVRATRGPWPITFWYLDRGSVQSISLSSVAIQ
jgi:hypothetical protein